MPDMVAIFAQRQHDVALAALVLIPLWVLGIELAVRLFRNVTISVDVRALRDYFRD